MKLDAYESAEPRKPIVPKNSVSAHASPKIIAPAAPRPVADYKGEKATMTRAAVGFILADASGNPIYANPEARKILTYPEDPRTFRSKWISLRDGIFPLSGERGSFSAFTCQLESVSGRRRYNCLAIPLDDPPDQLLGRGAVAIVLERHGAAAHFFAKMSERFRLTGREQQVVELLMRGLTNKEIAARMRISPNTVRAFIRSVMGKLGISTRSGIVGIAFSDIDPAPRWKRAEN